MATTKAATKIGTKVSVKVQDKSLEELAKSYLALKAKSDAIEAEYKIITTRLNESRKKSQEVLTTIGSTLGSNKKETLKIGDQLIIFVTLHSGAMGATQVIDLKSVKEIC